MGMHRIFSVCAATVIGTVAAANAQAATEIHWWHAMGGALGERTGTSPWCSRTTPSTRT